MSADAGQAGIGGIGFLHGVECARLRQNWPCRELPSVSMYGQNHVAVSDALTYARQPPSSFLGAPQVVAVASGVMGVAGTFRFTVGTEPLEPHQQSSKMTFEMVSHAPTVTVIPNAADIFAPLEAVTVVALVLVIGLQVFVWLTDGAGKVLARAASVEPGD